MNDRGLRYYVVDAFTNRLFTGNPAAVVPLTQWKEDRWLQNVAMEMNLSDTAFFVPNGKGYDLRWFTPKSEVDLCGHATLATAIVLAQLGDLADGACAAFSTRSGVLGAQRRGSRIQLDFPALTTRPLKPPPDLLEALNVTATYVGRATTDYLVEVASEEVLRRVKPDFKRLATVDCRGVVVTTPSDDRQFDFVSRFFAPAIGIDEDPVTGSAHCVLAPYWSSRLGKSQMVGFQASPRGGIVHVEVRDERVLLGGEGVVFASGTMAAD